MRRSSSTKRSRTVDQLIDKCTGPDNYTIEPELLSELCRLIDCAHDGRSSFLRAILVKIQKPSDPRQALLAFETLKYCARHCERALQAEIGRFRFLNEIIKLFLPKHLGKTTDDRVKQKAVEVLFIWTQEIQFQPKITEAYRLLKRNGYIGPDDPVVVNSSTVHDRAASRPNSVFADEKRTEVIGRLLRSGNRADMMEANRLIQSMAREDEILFQKQTDRSALLGTIRSNANVLSEILDNNDRESSKMSPETLATIDLLNEQMLKHNEQLMGVIDDIQRFETDDLAEAIETNELVLRVMERYKKLTKSPESLAPSDDSNELIDLETKSSSPPTQDLLLLETVENACVDLLRDDTKTVFPDEINCLNEDIADLLSSMNVDQPICLGEIAAACGVESAASGSADVLESDTDVDVFRNSSAGVAIFERDGLIITAHELSRGGDREQNDASSHVVASQFLYIYRFLYDDQLFFSEFPLNHKYIDFAERIATRVRLCVINGSRAVVKAMSVGVSGIPECFIDKSQLLSEDPFDLKPSDKFEIDLTIKPKPTFQRPERLKFAIKYMIAEDQISDVRTMPLSGFNG